jgi:hypothetical protein
MMNDDWWTTVALNAMEQREILLSRYRGRRIRFSSQEKHAVLHIAELSKEFGKDDFLDALSEEMSRMEAKV